MHTSGRRPCAQVLDEPSLPESLGELTGLTWLGLSNNQLTVLPDSLGNLTSLTWLDLAHNHLSTLPEWLSNLTALTRLDLTGNRLTALPDSLGNLTALTHLYLTENHLTVLPDSLGNLTALTRLDLAGNLLTVLPQSLAHLTAGEHPVNAPLQAWTEDIGTTTVADPADLDALFDRIPRDHRSGIELASEDGKRRLHITLDGARSGLFWEGEADVMVSWGPVPPGAPPGQTAGDADYAINDPWFTPAGADPFDIEITEEQARQAGHEFLRTGRRPTNIQWVDKP
ncbi:Imm1 family immunity protein [Micromonospora sp. WMMD812]|uniref:Imm1 family immunity protein n=1 Tax=Micromonospora sp. WMMD812 TaxID=3015152 RepID=UPI00248D1075|nr:Imm1 family immunity protein [Micromonospora sp. WMMD812]WBB69039.1 Imm1 family immunity protein [Micromonospora sp. WMMD812]